MTGETPSHTNRLIHASSPYLLQHAHNPVDWQEWGEEAWQKAMSEDKLVLVSIGYSACHWCHVMERETFENPDTAAIMNEFFVCIKVDREERPDVDQVYMDAVQLITGQGGWPLNIFCLPDGRPLHGGTYFPNRNWNQLLLQIESFYRNQKGEALDFAQKLTTGIRSVDILKIDPATKPFTPEDIEAMYELWSPQFDRVNGGNSRVPKFPMPVNFLFVLNYYLLSQNSDALEVVNTTLTKMAEGGINDQLGGGFARYSTDGVWLVPHFEKMLYDNAQLVSLYANAYRATQNPYYRQVIDETLAFIAREMTDKSGGFYSALDADSEGEEGKFYIWKKAELKEQLGKEEVLFSTLYNVTEAGNWEHGNNILHLKQTVDEFADEHKVLKEVLVEIIQQGKEKLMAARSQRVRPGLDDKIICCWNALMLKGYADAYLATGNKSYLDAALRNESFIEKYFIRNNHLLRIYKDGKTTINGFLEDYASIIEAYIQLYQCTFNERVLTTAKKLLETCIEEFYDNELGLFYFTSNTDAPLVTRKTDTADDVIPSGNSVMAANLYKLAYYFGITKYKFIADEMLARVAEITKKYPSWYSNWANMALLQAHGLYQVVIIGPNAKNLYKDFSQYIPNAIFAVSENANSSLSLFTNRYVAGKTLIYICKNESCSMPVETVEEAMRIIN